MFLLNSRLMALKRMGIVNNYEVLVNQIKLDNFYH